jgi:hypothetical protein
MFRTCLLNTTSLLVAACCDNSRSTTGKDDEVSVSRGSKEDWMMSNLDLNFDKLDMIVNGRRPGTPLRSRLSVTTGPPIAHLAAAWIPCTPCSVDELERKRSQLISCMLRNMLSDRHGLCIRTNCSQWLHDSYKQVVVVKIRSEMHIDLQHFKYSQ